MRKFTVTLYYHTSVTVEVEASTEEDAIWAAYGEAGAAEYDRILLDNLQSDGAPEVEEI